MSEEKFSKCGKGKNVSVEFQLFGKKMEIERKVPGKKIKVFWVEILLSSCSLVGLYVNLQVKVKVTGKMMKIFKVFFGWVFKVKV